MGALEGLVEKLKRMLAQGPAEPPTSAGAAPRDEQEVPTNAKPSGATDEPWAGP